MKKATKKLALVLVAAMVMGLCLVGCGSIVKDTLGDWCVDTVNGQPVAEYAAAAGVTEDMMQFNMKIEEDKITQTGMNGGQEFKPEFKSDGIELYKDGQHVGNLVWDKDKKVLSLDVNGAPYVFKKGAYTFSSSDAQQGGEEQASEAGAEGGAEEGGAAEGGAEDGAAEGGEDAAE